MKIAVICDTHYGVRGDSVVFMDHFKLFLDNVFFPVLKQYQIETVVHLGDLVDRRKFINFYTAKRMREDFLIRLPKTIILAGNHDVYHKRTNHVNALWEVVSGYDNINVLISPQTLNIGGVPILMVPWIAKDDEAYALEMINKTQSQICMGHLEIKGFEMYGGKLCEEGMDRSVFDKFDVVATGHFHHKSSQNNIHYLGAPYEMTWTDYDDPRGFHIFDTETREFEFIPNPYRMFHKIIYDDKDDTLENLMSVDLTPFANTYVRVLVKNKTNPYWFDMFIDNLEKCGAHDIKIVEERLTYNDNHAELIDQAEDTFTILRKCIEQTKVKGHRDQLEKLLHELYLEASAIEV